MRRRVLLKGESAEDFREVTDAEKAAIEKSDAAWVRPEQSVIDRCKNLGVVFNEKTGFFERNGLTDITCKQMMDILDWYQPSGVSNLKGAFFTSRVRTIIPMSCGYVQPDCASLFRECEILERIDLHSLQASDYSNAFYRCLKLVSVYLVMRWCKTTSDMFKGCVALRDVRLSGLKISISLEDSPLITLESLEYIVTTAENAEQIVITVHPDVFAKLTDETAPQVNLVTGGKVSAQATEYSFCRWNYDPFSPQLLENINYTISSAGYVGPREERLGFSLMSGYGAIVYFDGPEYNGAKSTVIDTLRNDSQLSVFHNPRDEDYDPDTRVDWVVVTVGENSGVTEWIPSLSEIEDEKIREKARWRLIRELAAARKIQFATV